MSTVGWVMVGVGSWVALSLPLALLFVAMCDHDCRAPGEDVPVIADEHRSPAPPHLWEPVLQR